MQYRTSIQLHSQLRPSSNALPGPQQSARLDIGEQHADVLVGILRRFGVVPLVTPPVPTKGQHHVTACCVLPQSFAGRGVSI